MHILGFETSCDETAAAVVKNGREILSNVVASSLKEHSRYGGIIPEIASRRQLEYINTVAKECIGRAGINLEQIDAVAVTHSPGLIGSLLVGLSYARALSFTLGRPLIVIDHIKAHLYAAFLHSKDAPQEQKHCPRLPAIGLIASGGHTSLYRIKKFSSFQLLGQTRDDAVGEAFDKVSRLLGLGFPGGPVIDQLARQNKSSKVNFSCAKLPDSYDFSFSGIKTAVLYYVKKVHPDYNKIGEIAHAFQKSIISVLIEKCLVACKEQKIKTLILGGGVTANSGLRQALRAEGYKNNINVFFPPLDLCVDNAAMIAGLAFQQIRNDRLLNIKKRGRL